VHGELVCENTTDNWEAVPLTLDIQVSIPKLASQCHGLSSKSGSGEDQNDRKGATVVQPAPKECSSQAHIIDWRGSLVDLFDCSTYFAVGSKACAM
jgi:hypothetical protein